MKTLWLQSISGFGRRQGYSLLSMHEVLVEVGSCYWPSPYLPLVSFLLQSQKQTHKQTQNNQASKGTNTLTQHLATTYRKKKKGCCLACSLHSAGAGDWVEDRGGPWSRPFALAQDFGNVARWYFKSVWEDCVEMRIQVFSSYLIK